MIIIDKEENFICFFLSMTMKLLPSLQVFLLLVSFLQSSFLLVMSETYDPPVKFFINCGSNSNITLDSRNFVSDVNSTNQLFSVAVNFVSDVYSTNQLFSVAGGDTVKDANMSSGSLLYNTARIFRRQSAYEFQIHKQGIYCVRLHFCSFKSGETNLNDAQFDASTANSTLLSNFSVPVGKHNTPVIKEYFLTINESKFRIEFTPTDRKAFAFITAIEVFLLPEDFVMDDITSTRTNNIFTGVRSNVLHTIHRINVGGPQDQDPLGRNWVTDDEHLISRASAKKCIPYNGKLGYGTLGAGPYSASDIVYSTCRELNSLESLLSNITWVFEVTKNTRNLVRLHFCNIVINASFIFNLYINNYTQVIDTRGFSDSFSHFADPLYYDFVVDSDNLASLKISVGLSQDSQVEKAYLNGLEIMELSKQSVLILNQHNSKKFIFILAGSIGGLTFLLLLGVLVFTCIVLKRKRKRKRKMSLIKLPSSYGGKIKMSEKGSTMINKSPVPNLNLNLTISLHEILDATKNFNSNLLIGEGGFGKVYRGTLKDGTKVAVKRCDPEHGQGIPEFETEILVLSKIRHRHLVSLIGYCDEFAEMILVYEFMEKGTLREHLYKSDSNSNLSWNQRLEICIGAARGLQYLHNGADVGIIHRDVKSTNILLDENFVAKVADFGLSTAVPPDPDHMSMGIKGSFGYIDPEYFKTFRFTEKSDVYSFGVVLLEVLCSRPAIVTEAKAEEVNLAEWGMHYQKKGELEKIIDPLLVGKIKAGSVRKYGEIVEKCLSKNGEERPRMYDVVWDLEYVVQLEKSGVEMNRKPHEDSITKFSSINVQRLPSIGSSIFVEKIIGSEGDIDDDLVVTESNVFSQLALDGAR